MTGPEVQVPLEVLLFSFRYALGRRTGAVSDVACTLRRHRDAFPGWMRDQIVADIERAIGEDAAGAPCDLDEWRATAKALRDVGLSA